MENVHINAEGKALTVRCTGEVTIEMTSDLKQAVEQALGQGEFEAVVMDLSEVGFLDSSGIGTLVALSSKIQNAGMNFYLYKLSKQVSKTLELVQLLTFFEIIEDEEELELAMPD